MATVWSNATDAGIVLPTHASTFYEIKPESPNTFTVVFPAGRQMQRNYCENERVAIESRISDQVGANVVLRLIVDSTIQPVVSRKNGERALSHTGHNYCLSRGFSDERPGQDLSVVEPTATTDFQELHRQVANNKVAQEIQEIFEAELSEVKPSAPFIKKPRRWGHSDD